MIHNATAVQEKRLKPQVGGMALCVSRLSAAKGSCLALLSEGCKLLVSLVFGGHLTFGQVSTVSASPFIYSVI